MVRASLGAGHAAVRRNLPAIRRVARAALVPAGTVTKAVTS